MNPTGDNMTQEILSPGFFITVTSNFDGYIRSIADLQAMPVPTGNQITLAKVPNSKLEQSPEMFTNAEALSLGWTQQQWDYAYGNQGPYAIMGAWSGGAYSDNHRMMCVFGAGHASSAWNATFAFDLNTMAWRRLNNPSRNVVSYTSPYPDGTPPCSHSYGQLVVRPDKNHLLHGYHNCYRPIETDPPPQEAGLFSWLPLDDLTTDREANLYAWNTYWPFGTKQPSNIGTLYTNSWGHWDDVNELYVLGQQGFVAFPGYEAGVDGAGTMTFSGSYTNVANQGVILNTNTREYWNMWWQESQQMRVMDASTYVQSGSLDVTVEPVSGDPAWIRKVSFDGSTPDSKLEANDSFCGVTYDKTHGRAVWWRPMYQSKAGSYYVDGVPLTEAQITQQNLMMTEVTDDKVARNLWIQESGDIQMPLWENSYTKPNWCSGGPYNRFAYIEEFDVFMYAHSWDNDIVFLKFPRVA